MNIVHLCTFKSIYNYIYVTGEVINLSTVVIYLHVHLWCHALIHEIGCQNALLGYGILDCSMHYLVVCCCTQQTWMA